MNTIIYLVATLIEYHDEPPTDCHSLYANYEDARKAMIDEIKESMENFTARRGEVVCDDQTFYEWRNYDGDAVTVVLSKMEVK
ncbi:hypothetical protein [uncultured Duncaniella sp.]|jgi:hypothetical protein|uniref:hypothetical protein n=1 Tax=uncultured Duncaniella sp. TaxID=2768039 RepID=UPI00272B2470|nr:hypothetical protein [uncultured Duncaniella sp.]